MPDPIQTAKLTRTMRLLATDLNVLFGLTGSPEMRSPELRRWVWRGIEPVEHDRNRTTGVPTGKVVIEQLLDAHLLEGIRSDALFRAFGRYLEVTCDE